MDNLTHAVLGLSAGVVVARKGGSLPAAAVAAFLAAEIPDIDVFIRSVDDPLASFRWHRHFTHSFSFMPIWAVVCAGFTAWFFKWINKPGINGRELIIPALAGSLTHLLRLTRVLNHLAHLSNRERHENRKRDERVIEIA